MLPPRGSARLQAEPRREPVGRRRSYAALGALLGPVLLGELVALRAVAERACGALGVPSAVGAGWILALSFAGLGYAIGRHEDRLRALADLDPVTRLRTRRCFDERLGAELRGIRRQGGVVSVLLLDIDQLKRINDLGGHQAGDAALGAVAAAVRCSVRARDVAARWGGDELVVLLPETRWQDALAVAERIRGELAARRGDAGAAPLVSIGIAEASTRARADSVFGAADRALYQAKARGGDAIVVSPAAASAGSRSELFSKEEEPWTA